MSILLCEDIDRLYDEMLASDKEFKKFVEDNKHKSTAEMLEDAGIVI